MSCPDLQWGRDTDEPCSATSIYKLLSAAISTALKVSQTRSIPSAHPSLQRQSGELSPSFPLLKRQGNERECQAGIPRRGEQ